MVGIDHAAGLIQAAVDDLGIDRACDLFLASEREYWQSRNRAGRVQKARQDALGMGWADHDHHTYRSSRQHYHRLIETLELLGFKRRERFYAGAEAGWGAQVLEQPTCGIAIFADVDTSAEEVAGVFAGAGRSARTWRSSSATTATRASTRRASARSSRRPTREAVNRGGGIVGALF